MATAKKEEKKAIMGCASSGHITKLKQSIFAFRYLWFWAKSSWQGDVIIETFLPLLMKNLSLKQKKGFLKRIFIPYPKF
jgi:hypothetical protein